jgi:hypothetical protein
LAHAIAVSHASGPLALVGTLERPRREQREAGGSSRSPARTTSPR